MLLFDQEVCFSLPAAGIDFGISDFSEYLSSRVYEFS